MQQRVAASFAFLNTADRLWAREYVLSWRSLGASRSQDVAALLRGIAGGRAAPLQALCVGTDTDGTGVFANELLWLCVPVRRAAGVLVGVTVDKMSVVDGFAPFASPPMPGVGEGPVRAMGRFAMCEATGEVIAAQEARKAPVLFPAKRMTSLMHWRSAGAMSIMTNSYFMSEMLPEPDGRMLNVADFARAAVSSSSFHFHRKRCAVCGEMPAAASPCSCISAGRRRKAIMDRSSAGAGLSDEAGRIDRNAEVEAMLAGQFGGVNKVLLRPRPGGPMIALVRPCISLKASFLDNQIGDKLADDLTMLAIGAAVQSAPPQRAHVLRPGRAAFLSAMGGGDQKTSQNWCSGPRSDVPASRELQAVVDGRWHSLPATETGFVTYPFRNPPCEPHPIPVTPDAEGGSSGFSEFLEKSNPVGLSPEACNPSLSGEMPTSTKPSNRTSVKKPQMKRPSRPTAAQILEERRLKNRLSAKKSGIKRKEEWAQLEGDLERTRARRDELLARQAALQAENEELREALLDNESLMGLLGQGFFD